MMVINILKSGAVLDDITGHIVPEKDAKLVYEIMDKLKGENSESNE